MEMNIYIGFLVMVMSLTAGAAEENACPGAETPKAVPNSKVKCTTFAGCRMSCNSRYLFPTGEKNVYFTCKDNQWIVDDAYTDCRAQCKPPCGHGGDCVRPNDCDCTETGYKGKACQKK
ncbi:unnamed protein product, partial [Meganyctiphanes norvegica]